MVSLIIEVKGAWHAQVRSAMKTQLVERYLRENSCQAGIYLVGWFAEPMQVGNGADRPKRARRGKSLEALRHELEAQAENLTTDTRFIRAFVLDASLRG